MKSNREVRENSRTGGRQFDSFGFHGSMFPSIFGGKDPFDDPFFSRPHGSLFATTDSISSSNPGNLQPTSRLKGPLIEELDSDDEGAPAEDENDVGSAAWTNRNPLVEHPEDDGDDHGRSDRRQDPSSTTKKNEVEAKKPVSRSVSFQRVTYGGINGTYYTATTSRRTGNDGVTWEESKQANRTTGQAAHKVSRGIHDKGHSVTRKLGADGKVETVQTLQNLHEDEIEGFEKDWGGIADSHFHDILGMSGSGSNRLGPLAAWGSFPSPFREMNRSRSRSRSRSESGSFDPDQSARPKKVVTINIE